MPEPTCVRDVQRLSGKVVALNRFMSRSAERCLPFFKKLRKVSNFEWTEDCRKAFEELKRYLSSPHVLSSPLEWEELLIYLSASEQAVSAVLVRVEGGEQKLVFYVSKVLKDAKVRYLNIEKIAYALLLAVRKFRVYLESHQGVVMTDQPLKKILHRPETSGRMLAWSIEISPYYLEYRPRTAIKSQALADFIAECSFSEKQVELGVTPSETVQGERERQPPRDFGWKLYMDGASGARGSGAGIMLKGPEGFKVCYALRLEFSASNNVAKYEALINGMLVAMEVGETDLEVNSDSQLVVNQITGAYQARDPTMLNYLAKVKDIEAELKSQGIMVKYQRIPREENEEADLLSRLSREELEQLPDEVYIQHVNIPTFDKANIVMEVEEGQNWMIPYLEYLERGKLPEDKAKAKKIEARAANYQAEAEEFVRRCDVCQRFANSINVPATPQSSISSPWSFSQWGIDILGPFPKTTGQKKFVIVAVEYFSKWPEAETVPTITARKMIDFVWDSIICRFGIPRVLISDNGRQFDCSAFREFTRNMGIWHKFSSVAHPQTNGQTEITNRAILQGLKKRLDGAKGNWADELNSILWAFRTAPRASTKETPFALAFGTEAVVPIELQVPIHRVQSNDENANSDKLRSNLDALEEVREEAQVRTTAYQQRAARYYNQRVRERSLKVEDLALRNLEATGKRAAVEKLAPT
ncbi:uncharacterized protein LOC110617941 [Manihot esculenta]|uniref:uncharacterized protein LOC110617941 n=1 Tax=Manihot esculenta TaxID=3983 RepID=UPI000B5D2B69|nr:uncharacterized protein LOC110617941 [Manihot esculenta]